MNSVGAEDTGTTVTRRAVPPRALALSLAALALPAFATTLLPAWLDREGALLIWLPAIVPAFLFTFYRGWHGASLSLAAGMAALALTQVGVMLLGLPVPSWSYVLAVVGVLLAVSLGAGGMAEALLRARENAEVEAFTDTLTGLPNRRHASLVLDTAWGATLRGSGLAVVIFDIDHFKKVNDTHGHAEGDRVLKVFGEILAERTRRMDLSARFGGEEFLNILHDCPIARAAVIAEEVREQLGAHDFGWGRVTASAGVAAVEPGMGSPDVLVAAADRALYEAKDQGRNRVCRADESVPRSPKSPDSGPATPKTLTETRVLVVDDDPNTLRVTGGHFTRLGSSVTMAESPREAVGILHSGMPFDVLVTEIVMPEMSGFTLVELATRVISDLRVLYVSGYVQKEAVWGGTPGARSVSLSKPIEFDDLVAALEELLQPAASALEPSSSTTRGARSGDTQQAWAERSGDTSTVPDSRILIVDDDPSNVQALVRLFEEAGYPAPIGVSDTRKVRGVIREHEIDVVVLDLNIPEMNGFEVMTALFGIDRLRRTLPDSRSDR